MLEVADENNVPFLASALSFDALLAAVPFILLVLVALTLIAQATTTAGASLDPEALFHRFLPAHDSTPGLDPLDPVENLLGAILRNRDRISLVAAPLFVWFSTRLFGSMRNALNSIYDVQARPRRSHGFLLNYLLGKARDGAMVVVMVLLFVANTSLTAGLALARARGAELAPRWAFWAGWFGTLVTEALALSFSLALFVVVYRWASPRVMSWQSATLAAVVGATGFEIAKRLYGLYLAHAVTPQAAYVGARLGAIVLFVLWVYYMAIVFLLGGVVAETWELRAMQRRQRALLA